MRGLLPYLKPGDLVVGKSTVPVRDRGKARGGNRRSGAGRHARLEPGVRRGHAVEDTFRPDRLVYGVPAGAAGERAVDVLNQVYAKAVAGSRWWSPTTRLPSWLRLQQIPSWRQDFLH